MKTRKSILALAVLLVLVFMQGQAGAFFMTGNRLVEDMREYEKATSNDPSTVYHKSGTYGGYITGVFDALGELLSQPPSGITIGQAGAVVAKYLKNHPERWNENAATLVIDALKEAFPFKK